MAEAEEQFDVVVVGGGPAGTSSSTILAKGGKRVLLLDREKFPRFRIGESLLPGGWELWKRLGVTEKFLNAGFTVKQGINFGMFNTPPDVVLLTAEYPQYFEKPWTFHVERVKFDQILLDHAREHGVEVREEWTVKDVIFEDAQAVGVLAGPNGGEPHPIRCKVVVDATGRDCLLSRRLNLRKPDPALNKISHFTHFKGAFRRNPADVVKFGEVIEGSVMTDIHSIEGGWVWFIPLANDITSIGVVLDARFAKTLGESTQEVFDRAVQSCDVVREWVQGAEQVMEMHTIAGVAYLNDEFTIDGAVMIGDASMFVDPVFSAGVTIAMRGGIMAADAILDCFAHDDFSRTRLKAGYEDKIRYSLGRIIKMIYNWYKILERKDANNIISRARDIPLLRERFVTLLSGGYDKVDMEMLLTAAGEPESTYLIS